MNWIAYSAMNKEMLNKHFNLEIHNQRKWNPKKLCTNLTTPISICYKGCPQKNAQPYFCAFVSTVSWYKYAIRNFLNWKNGSLFHQNWSIQIEGTAVFVN
jgi:hypothetical protein